MREYTLVDLAQSYSAFVNLSLSRIGFLAANDGKFFGRLANGKTCTLRTSDRVLQWFSDHWPAGLEWPADVPRPLPSGNHDHPREAA